MNENDKSKVKTENLQVSDCERETESGFPLLLEMSNGKDAVWYQKIWKNTYDKLDDTKPIKLKIVSEGTGCTSKVIDMETGRMVQLVTSVDVSIKSDGLATAIIKVEHVNVDLEIYAQKKVKKLEYYADRFKWLKWRMGRMLNETS